MPLFQIATAAHLAGSVVLALFFVLLARHDPRPYLRSWTAAWIAQVLALAALMVASRWDRHTSLSLYLFLEAVHGVLILFAAQNYAHGQELRRRHALLLGLLALWSATAPLLFRQENALQSAQFAVLAATYLAGAVTLWPLREPAGMGLRLTTNVLGLLGLLHVGHAVAFALTTRVDKTELTAYLDIAPFAILLLQMLLALGMVLAVMEAAQWALATTNTQLKEAERRLKVLAETDPLTGCFNRRVFRDLVDDVRASGVEAGVMVLLDLDGLKTLNDRQGHAAGDDAIRSVAEAIRSRTRTTDVVVRWGGDEFVVVIPGATAAEGEGRRAQIVAAIAEAGLSASAGLAIYGPERDVMIAVQEADAAMYKAKAARKAALGTAS